MRNLEREIAKLARKAVKEILTCKKKTIKVTPKNSRGLSRRAEYRYGEAELEDQVGVVTGLAWTEVGGELLTIEGVMMPGKGKMTVTGNLRDVMKELISGRHVLCALARRRLRHRAAAVRQEGHPRPRAGRCDPQGRSLGRRRHGDGDRLGDDRHSGAAGTSP